MPANEKMMARTVKTLEPVFLPYNTSSGISPPIVEMQNTVRLVLMRVLSNAKVTDDKERAMEVRLGTAT